MPPESPTKIDFHGGVNSRAPLEQNFVTIRSKVHTGSKPRCEVISMGQNTNDNESNENLASPSAAQAAQDWRGQTGTSQPEEMQPILFVDEISPGISDQCNWLGAEVQVENKISRRCSYEEMVHEESEIIPNPKPASELESSEQWHQAVVRITQWAISLQEIQDDQIRGGGQPVTSKCLCHKASALRQKLSHLATVLMQDPDDLGDELDLIQIVDDVQSALRAGVSIQISKPSEAVMSKAVSVVEAAMVSCDKAAYIQSAVESILKLVEALLNVPTCSHNLANNSNLLDDSDRIRDVSPTRLMEQDEEEDIRSRVESMFQNEDEDLEFEDDMDTESNSSRTARKRKQIRPGGKHVTSPTSSPSKRPRKLKSPAQSGMSTPNQIHSNANAGLSLSAPAKICQASPALDLLETKKKVQRNSLYHWVLWREALRGEKDRTQKELVPSRAKLAFN